MVRDSLPITNTKLKEQWKTMLKVNEAVTFIAESRVAKRQKYMSFILNIGMNGGRYKVIVAKIIIVSFHFLKEIIIILKYM